MKQLLNVHLPGANATIQLKWADGELERLVHIFLYELIINNNNLI